MGSVGDGDLVQFFANFVFAVYGMMALGAEGDQVVWMIVGLVLINMVYMQAVAPSLALFVAKLTSPSVAVLNLFAECFPVMRIVPIGNATFPSWIVSAASGAADLKCIRLRTQFNPMINYCLLDRFVTNVHFFGNFPNGVILYTVQFYKFILFKHIERVSFTMLFAWLQIIKFWLDKFSFCATVMTGKILKPSLVARIPCYQIAAATSAQGRLPPFFRQFTWSPFPGFSVSSALVTISL